MVARVVTEKNISMGFREGMVWAVDLQLGDILHDHVCSSVSAGTSGTNSEEGGGGFKRTDVIVKADEGPGKLCECSV